MSKLKCYISFFIFCALATKASAQSMIPMTSTMRTPMGNVPYTYYVPGPSYYHYYNPVNISA